MADGGGEAPAMPDGGGEAPAMPDGGIVEACETPIPVESMPGMPCRYPIPAPPCDVVSSSHIRVMVNGSRIYQDATHTNGWDYVDYATIEIYGPSCDAITAGAPTSVDIGFIIAGPP